MENSLFLVYALLFLTCIRNAFTLPFDNVYVIHSMSKSEHYFTVPLQLKQMNLTFRAVEGKSCSDSDVASAWRNRSSTFPKHNDSFRHFSKYLRFRAWTSLNSCGAYAYLFTWLEVIEDARRRGFKTIFVLDDDVMFVERFLERLKHTLSVAPRWDVLFLGASEWSDWNSLEFSEGFYMIGNKTCGSYALLLKRRAFLGMKDDLETFMSPPDRLPLLNQCSSPSLSCLVSYPNIVVPDVSSSAIRSGRDMEQHARMMRWPLHAVMFPPEVPKVTLLARSEENVAAIRRELFTTSLYVRVLYYSQDGWRPFHGSGNISSDITKFSNSTPLPLGLRWIVVAPRHAHVQYEDIWNFLRNDILGDEKPTILQYHSTRSTDVVHPFRHSIIVTTHLRNQGQEAALSAACQTWNGTIEVIVVHDRPSIPAPLESFARLPYAHHVNRSITTIQHSIVRGGAAARNTGILNSHGKYVSFLDGDDVHARRKVSIVENAFHSMPNAHGLWTRISNRGYLNPRGSLHDAVVNWLFKELHMQSSTLTIDVRVVHMLNGFDESFDRHQDVEFMTRFFLAGYKAERLSQRLVHVKMCNSSSNIPHRDKLQRIKCHLLEKILPMISDIREAGEVTKNVVLHQARIFRAPIKENNVLCGCVDSLVNRGYCDIRCNSIYSENLVRKK